MIAALLVALALPPPPPPPPPEAHPRTETPCGKCHTPDGWAKVTFDHARAGFPLEGQHARVSCKACHGASLDRTLPTSCAGCHRDVHRGELGMRCEGCHDVSSWASSFGAEAHRRTNFPLTGRHAFIPCVECHPDVRDRSFAGNAVPCVSCHQKDLLRTASAGLDHFRLGFTGNCLSCHQAWSFTRGRFPQHASCFAIDGGPHAGIACLSCHTSIPSGLTPGTCNTLTAHCTGCHAHAQERTDPIHRNVDGYQFKDRKCFECHEFSSFKLPSGLRSPR